MSGGRKPEDRDMWIAFEEAAAKLTRVHDEVVSDALAKRASVESAAAKGLAFWLSIIHRSEIPLVMARGSREPSGGMH